MDKLQSQWEFGDLFTRAATPPPRKLFSVSELTLTVKRLLQEQVGQVWVAGEITNCRLQSSGHLYFTIKDGNAQLNCVLFRGEARALNRAVLRDGVGLNVYGELTVYEARGQYQLIVTAVELQGVGALQAAFEKLKQRLNAEGLFASERKRPLPRFPRRVGLVTSSSGAAIRDVLQAIRRRYAGLELVLASCRVQGQGAGEEVACAIRLLNEWTAAQPPDRQVDVILVTRGGGSLEDLWAFNEESVARAVFESRIPVVSGVGHEIDFTISDFVADFRAATPTAAAEILTEGYFSSRAFVAKAAGQLRQCVRDYLGRGREDLAVFTQRLQRQHPVRWLQEQWQRLDDLQGSMKRCAAYVLRTQQTGLAGLAKRLVRVHPAQLLAGRRERVDDLRERLAEAVKSQARLRRQEVVTAAAKLRLLSPLNVLDRGYSITTDAATNKVLQSERDTVPGQRLRTRLQQGEVESIVQSPTSPAAPG